ATRFGWGRRIGLSLLFVALIASAPAQTNLVPPKPLEVTEAYLREHYTKVEYKIPMRDGVRLFTSVYAPKDDLQPYPLLLTRTPYSLKPYSEDRYPDPGAALKHYAKEKFIFVLQDVRGRNGSEGEFVHMRPQQPGKTGPRDVDESTDAYDTIDWL